jgi:uncharacterized membrane protein
MTSLFSRTAEINVSLAKKFEKCGWASGVFNFLCLIMYFWNVYSNASIIYRFAGSFVASAVIIAIEFAAMSIIFDPSVLDDFMAQTKSENEFSKLVGVLSVIFLSCLAAATFYYDYTINIAQMRMGKTIDSQILAVVMVLISEVFFWTSAVLSSAAKNNAGNTGSRR